MSTISGPPNFAHGFPTPGPQASSPRAVLDHAFFLSDVDWMGVREQEQFDYIVVGSGFCALAFVERILKRAPQARILILERGPFFLPAHFQNLAIPYEQTLGGHAETFPWSLSARTAMQPAGGIQWQHGMVPFFGGRSIMWSAWCPRPIAEEMADWPEETIRAAQRNFASAEELLGVVPADQIDAELVSELLPYVLSQRPIYGVMQRGLQVMLSENLAKISTATRWLPAPLAAGSGRAAGVDFAKFAVPAALLSLVQTQAKLAQEGTGSPLQILTECTVDRIHQEGGQALALETSRGMVGVGSAKVVLAMGTLPPTTLLLNSFPQASQAGERFCAHFITSVVARVPRSDYEFAGKLAELELAAIYLAGKNPDNDMQYHVQLSVLCDLNPAKNAEKAARNMPDVVATASMAQLLSSEDYLVFVCAVLGELDMNNKANFFRRNDGADPTTNVTLQVLANESDRATWDVMDEATFQMLELALSPKGHVEYWHGDPVAGSWSSERPSIPERRVSGLVHESSTLWIGDADNGVVGTDYRPHGVENVFVTGGGLWPAGGSWNPTMTMVALAQDLADRQLAAVPSASTTGTS